MVAINSMDYKQTSLWKRAFKDARTDATTAEQAHLTSCYELMRQRASALVAKIATDLPYMTIHNVTHLDALWEMASIACGELVDLNPAEALVFGGAVLLHDAAMSLAAFPGGTAELKKTIEWRDLYARYSSRISSDDKVGLIEAENRATEDALRLLHAKQAENLPKISWASPQGQAMFLIEDQQIRNFYGPKIGKIAYSHWWSIAKVEEELSGTLGALAGITSCTVDLLKVACLLRVADAMHLDQRRAPAFEFALTQPTGISANHWKFQERMAKPFVRGDALVYSAQPPFEVDMADAWWTAFDALQMVDRELRSVDRVLRDRQKTPFIVRRVSGAHSPSDLAATIETTGWRPVDSTIRVTDVPKIVATIGGEKLYGSNLASPVRELIQNGLDAISARRRLQSRPNKWGELKVALKKIDDRYWLCVEDNGVGMSETVLTGPLIDFGNSFWKSSLAIQEFPGLASAGMKARGKYGIGFFSVFMLGEHVRVVTRRYDRDARSGRVLEFRNGLGSRPNLREAMPDEIPIDGGTRVEIKLHINPSDPGGLLHRGDGAVQTLMAQIGTISPAVDVAIKIVQNEQVVGSMEANDWLEVESSSLINRIAGNVNDSKEKSWPKLFELRDEDGKIYGRARIESSRWIFSHGLITVDGLAATRVPLISGLLVGVETTASRNSARPIVPDTVLAAWASEQAIIAKNSDLRDIEKARVAEVVMACGGSIDQLPIIFWREKWVSGTEFIKALEGIEEVVVHKGEITYDEDDDVRKSDFESWFEIEPGIAKIIGDSGNNLCSIEWIASVTHGKGIAPIDLVEQLLASVWQSAEVEETFLTVGNVSGIDISRKVTIFRRPNDVE